MFYIICNILYYIGMVVAGIVLVVIISRMMDAFTFEFYTKNEINKANGVYENY